MFGNSFFFDGANEYIHEKFGVVFKDGNRNGNRHATENWDIMKGYGWLNTLYDIAQDGLFTKHPHNAIDSVMKTNLYECFTYLSWKTSNNEYQNAVRDGMQQDAEIKARQKQNR